MKQAQIARHSIRTALVIGFAVTLGLWLYTGFAFTRRINSMERAADDVASRYTRAQDLLSTVRAHVLRSSIGVRDGLLQPDSPALEENREQIEASYRIIKMAIADYEPMIGFASFGEQLHQLELEIDQFHTTSMSVLTDAANHKPSQIRDVLTQYMVPRREAALAVSEQIQSMNRQAFIAQQGEIARIHRDAESRSQRQIGYALIVGLGSMLIVSLYAGTLEKRLRHQMQRDSEMSNELQQMAIKVIAAQEEERRTISRDLHDQVGQELGAIRIELTAAQRAIANGTATSETLNEAQTIADDAIQSVRNLSQLLHPAVLDDLGLPSAIEAALRGLERRHEVRAQLLQIDLPNRLPREIELAAYRIVQEGLNNIGKHAHASRCTVRLMHVADRLVIEVEDDGVGFSEDHRPIVARGLGLISIRERAHRLGGTFKILSSPGSGTRLVITLPEAVPGLA